jgi:Kef-type K+ transport system membrane component KefB
MESLHEPPYLAMALLSLVMIGGWLLKKYTGTPLVVGMLLMGFLLGPSGFGYVFPNAYAGIFTPAVMVFLALIARMGLTFYQGITGFDFDWTKLCVFTDSKVNVRLTLKQLTAPFAVSMSGIVATFVGALFASAYIYKHFCTKETNYWAFALYVGAALSISSIVTIGYILKKLGLHKSQFGMNTMAAVLIVDVVGWVIVCCIDAFARSGSLTLALPKIAVILGFIALMALVIRPLLQKCMPTDPNDSKVLGIVVIATLFIATICESIGIHPLFGSFVLGAVMPKTPVVGTTAHGEANYSDVIAVKLEYFQEVFFLPLFLGFSGLRTNLWSLMSYEAVIACALVTLVAVVAKFAGIFACTYYATRSLRESLGSSSLMIALGLMGLMIVNMGMDAGVFTQQVYTIMIMPGLVSTVLAYPLLNYFYLRESNETQAKADLVGEWVTTEAAT